MPGSSGIKSDCRSPIVLSSHGAGCACRSPVDSVPPAPDRQRVLEDDAFQGRRRSLPGRDPPGRDQTAIRGEAGISEPCENSVDVHRAMAPRRHLHQIDYQSHRLVRHLPEKEPRRGGGRKADLQTGADLGPVSGRAGRKGAINARDGRRTASRTDREFHDVSGVRIIYASARGQIHGNG